LTCTSAAQLGIAARRDANSGRGRKAMGSGLLGQAPTTNERRMQGGSYEYFCREVAEERVFDTRRHRPPLLQVVVETQKKGDSPYSVGIRDHLEVHGRRLVPFPLFLRAEKMMNEALRLLRVFNDLKSGELADKLKL